MSLPAAKNLRSDAVDCKPRDYDWSAGYGEKWDYFEADYCQDCGQRVVARGEERHHYLDNETDCHGYICCEGPMMNYFYPLPISRGDSFDGDEAAKKIVKVSLCVVHLEDSDEWGLALTGGGMNLSWDICSAYIRLGYLPPAHFCDLPNFAGMKLSRGNAAIIAACRRALKLRVLWAKADLERLQRLRQTLKERGRTLEV